ncbi:MAG: hypothetical protein M3495_01265 [Pseudomonadota bacterium]|nr:hypothetical protein [Pseudomonadota bacterium]
MRTVAWTLAALNREAVLSETVGLAPAVDLDDGLVAVGGHEKYTVGAAGARGQQPLLPVDLDQGLVPEERDHRDVSSRRGHTGMSERPIEDDPFEVHRGLPRRPSVGLRSCVSRRGLSAGVIVC